MNPSAANKQRGAALPLTLLLVAFNVIIVVALLIYATTELNASRNAVNTDAARLMARNGIELAGALIAANSTNNAYVSYQNIITNLSAGDTAARLETKIANTIAPDSDLNWQREVNNPTSLHSGFATAADDHVDLNYAANLPLASGDTESGYILPRTNPVSSNWRNLHPNMFNMKWVNVYKGDSSQATNLIGRFAFWVDDESTKLNINYSGSAGMYWTNTEELRGLSTYLPQTRELFKNSSASPAIAMGQAFPASKWPIYIDVGGAYGISRISAINILADRGNPQEWADSNWSATYVGFRPYYSLLEVRRADPSAIHSISLQSQLGFTATMFSREPELSFSKGIPRFDMLKVSGDFARTNIPSATIPSVYAEFTNNITANYPGFSSKYSLPQYAAALYAAYQTPSDGEAAATNFPYTNPPSILATTNYNARGLPLINETDIKLSTVVDTTNGYQTTTLDANIELIMLASSTSGTSAYTYFNELGMVDSTAGDANTSTNIYTNTVNRYRGRVEFNPPILVGPNLVSDIELKQTNASTTNWFHQKYVTSNQTYIRILDTNLTGCFGVLTGSLSWTNKNIAPTDPATNLQWTLPSSLRISVYYSPSNTNDPTPFRGLYQSILSPSGVVPEPSATNTNFLTKDSISRVVYHVTSQTRQDSGIRGDPRLGLHGTTAAAASSNTTLTTDNTNSVSSLGRTNTTWNPDSTSYLTDTLAPDITPPFTVFASDAGLPICINEGNTYPFYMGNSADIGDVPITTYKSGTHLAWSTPRLWGDGRTNLGDGMTYPPDWLMLDCIHTAMLPVKVTPVFCATNGYRTNEHLSYGRINANGLKSYFQIPLGSGNKTDTIMDSMLANVATKDYRWYYNSGGDPAQYPPAGNPPNYGGSYRNIDAWSGSGRMLRTNILNYIRDKAMVKNSNNTPYLTPFEFTADLAGNTNLPNIGSRETPNTLMSTNGGYWEAYSPGSIYTSDRRIESLVRGLQQRFTTRGWQFSVYSLGQALQVTASGQTNILGESYMQAVWERAPKHNTGNGTIMNASPGGAPPMRMLYMRELR